ncbi:MAG TPA: hypothetical protein VJT09_16695 [Pyrinomonadaceae bacterium]|nr:hypothetical protein [Pyrinomonadaceae bacterium]
MAQQEQKVPNPWSLRAHIITDSFLNDATTLSGPERPLLLAQLGALWWKDDPEKARAWFERAVSDLAIAPDQEGLPAKQRRFSVLRSLLGIIAPKDKKLGTKLSDLLTSAPDDDRQTGRTENARALLDAALTALETDPHFAVELAIGSLRAGRTYGYNVLLWKLRSRDGKLADALFTEMLVASRTTYDFNLLTALMYAAYPQTVSASLSKPVPADELRRNLLNVIASHLLRAFTSPAEERLTCQLALSVSPLQNEFFRLLPQRASAVSVVLTKCQLASSQPPRPRVEESSQRETPLETADETLRAAERIPDLKNRADYISRAINLSAQQQKFDQAVAILDGINSELRNEIGDAWANWRWDFASSSAIAYLKQNDHPAMQKVIDATPVNLRPLVKIVVAKYLAANGDVARAIELFREGRNGLASADVPNKHLWYPILVDLYVKHLPTDAPEVFREMVTAINRVEQPKSTSSQDAEATSGIGDLWQSEPLKIPASILEVDELGVLQATSSIQSPTDRARVRLAILSACLEEMRTYSNRNKTALVEAKSNDSQ